MKERTNERVNLFNRSPERMKELKQISDLFVTSALALVLSSQNSASWLTDMSIKQLQIAVQEEEEI